MKKTLLILALTALFSCEGPQGPIGPQGANGTNGARGEKGDTGLIGLTGRPGTDGTNGAAGTPGTRGEKGDKGDKGATGERGLTGANGKDGTQALIYDFNLDVSSSLANYKYPNTLLSSDVVLVYINRGSSYSPLPYKGFARTTDNIDFLRLDMSFDAFPNLLFIQNETIIPAGSTFNFRVVILRGTKAGSGLRNATYEQIAQEFNI